MYHVLYIIQMYGKNINEVNLIVLLVFNTVMILSYLFREVKKHNNNAHDLCSLVYLKKKGYIKQIFLCSYFFFFVLLIVIFSFFFLLLLFLFSTTVCQKYQSSIFFFKKYLPVNLWWMCVCFCI